jgi:hypothetical protein
VSTAENIAIERRVADIEARLAIVEPVRIITTLAVYRRGPERVCRTVDDVFEFARLDPVTEHVLDLPDLDVLIDAESGTHLERDGDDPEYLELCEGVRTIEVKISCHEHQVEPILSDAPVTATTGGARARRERRGAQAGAVLVDPRGQREAL